jgi:tetratricopeptide (TPR) repeat protein
MIGTGEKTMKGLRILLAAVWCLASLPCLAQTDAKDFEKRVVEAVGLFRDGKTDEATAAFEILNKENPRSSDVQAWLGYLYLRGGTIDLAIPLLRGAEAQRPTDVEVLNNLGNAYLANQQFDLALEKYAAITKLNAKLFEPFYNSGTIYIRQKNWNKALESFTQAARLQPNDPFVQNNLGVVNEALKQDARAAQHFKKAADLRPDNVTFARNAGLTLARLNKSEALAFLERAHAGDGDTQLTLALGDAYLRANRPEEALKLYESVRDSQSRNAAFWFNLGVLRSKVKDEAGSEQAYRRSLEINSNDLDSLNNLGLVLYRKGQYPEAQVLFDKLAGLNPSSVAAKINLGAASMMAGDLKKAIDAWKSVIRVEPARIEVRLDLANALFRVGDIDGAKYHFNQALLMSHNNAEALNGLGLCHLTAGKLPQAEAAFRSAIESDAKLISAYNNLAITLEKNKQRAEAIKILEKAAKIDPDDEETKKNLQRLRLGD